MKWERTGRRVLANGESDTIYVSKDCPYRIESRKRAIPHNGREGYWMHTTYFLIDGTEEKEFWSLSDAKDAAERRNA